VNNRKKGHSTPVVMFGTILLLTILAGAVMTFEQADPLTTSDGTPPGTTGLAKPHPPLDRAPGQPVIDN
jgi:hypothetical protein